MSRSPSLATDACTTPAGDVFGLVGAGGHARVVAASAARLGLTLQAVFDADEQRIGASFEGIEVLPETTIDRFPNLPLHLGIGANAIRRRLSTACATARWQTVIHPGAQAADDVAVGEGCFITMGAVVQVGVRLGRHVIVNTGAIIDHDCRIGDFAHIAPGVNLCGAVTIGADVLVGAGSVVLPGLTVGAGAIIGAGSVVTRDVESGARVVGSPARAMSLLKAAQP